MHCQSTVVYAIVDFVVQCHRRRRIHHVPAKRDVIGCNIFASGVIVDTYSVQHFANEAARDVQVL